MKHGLHAHVETAGSSEKHGEGWREMLARYWKGSVPGEDSCQCLSLED